MLNKLLIQGRFTASPEMRSTATAIDVVRFTLASKRDRTNQSGEREADFIQCVAWRNMAHFICRNFTKGQSALVEGAVRSKKWIEDDKTRYGLEVEVSNIYFCGSKLPETVSADGQGGTLPGQTNEADGTMLDESWPVPGANAFSMDGDEPF